MLAHKDGGDAVLHRSALHFTLVEANAKKAAFLRAAIRETGAQRQVANGADRVICAKNGGEGGRRLGPRARAAAGIAGARRALCPRGQRHAVPEGQGICAGIDAAAQSWSFDVVDYASATDSGGRVLAIRNLSPKARP